MKMYSLAFVVDMIRQLDLEPGSLFQSLQLSATRKFPHMLLYYYQVILTDYYRVRISIFLAPFLSFDASFCLSLFTLFSIFYLLISLYLVLSFFPSHFFLSFSISSSPPIYLSLPFCSSLFCFLFPFSLSLFLSFFIFHPIRTVPITRSLSLL